MQKTVIVIDDSAFIVSKVARFFQEQMGFKVVGKGYDGETAIALYRHHRPDLITLDISMPNKNGLMAVKEILWEFPEANILIISAIRGDMMLECMGLGAKGYVEKPLDFSNPLFVHDFQCSVEEIFET